MNRLAQLIQQEVNSSIGYTLNTMTMLDACRLPKTYETLQIGLDDPISGYSLCVWHIGKVNGRFAIYFEQHPHFPLWLQFDTLDAIIMQEPFAEDLVRWVQ